MSTQTNKQTEKKRGEKKEREEEGKERRGEKMCGIFAYLNYKVNRERRYILQVLFNGLRRLEYRGYDSAGIAIDSDPNTAQCSCDSNSDSASVPIVFRQEGNIESLVKSVYQGLILRDFMLLKFYIANSVFYLLHRVCVVLCVWFLL